MSIEGITKRKEVDIDKHPRITEAMAVEEGEVLDQNH